MSEKAPWTRATDIDRSTACTRLDEAYAEGQLDALEHRTRLDKAMAARTLGELAELTADLQFDEPPPEPVTVPVPRRPIGPLVTILGTVAGVVVLIVVIVVVAGHAGRHSSRSAVGGASADSTPGVSPVVVAPQSLHSADGFAAFVSAVRAKFGDTVVDRAVVYPTYAVVTRAIPGQPTHAQNYYYQGGFSGQPSPEPRQAGTDTVDLGQADMTKLLGLIAGAPQTLNVQNPTSTYLIIENTGGGGTVAIYESNEYHDSGYLQVGLDGTVQRVQPAGR